jgi:hypothetical protein
MSGNHKGDGPWGSILSDREEQEEDLDKIRA